MSAHSQLQASYPALSYPAVNSYNEWDPLEEVIVGTVTGATVPEWHVTLRATMPERYWDFYRKYGGKPFPREQIDLANRDLEEFVHVLEAEGVTVRRPNAMPFGTPYGTPEWQCPGGLYAAMPRDVLLVVGNEIIEAPMAWRSRYFEVHAYRELLKEYFAAGARWTCAPKPQMNDALYDQAYVQPEPGEPMRYALTEFEPAFDAADFIRCGRDIFAQRSHVTNEAGIAWLERHLGDDYTIHTLAVEDRSPMHIDATFVPLAPGKLLINPERVREIPECFKSWDVLTAPKSHIPDNHPLYMSSKWLCANILMLDQRRVIVEAQEESTRSAFKRWGFEPIPCNFRWFNTFGGSFHCATVDVRRRGTLESYF